MLQRVTKSRSETTTKKSGWRLLKIEEEEEEEDEGEM